MHYSKKEIVAFLDGVAPFDVGTAREWRKHPIIWRMACDIEAHYEDYEKALKLIRKLEKKLGRAHAWNALSFITVAGSAGFAIKYYLDSRKVEEESETK